ncbi:MAG: hypothetical protein M3N52_08965 [Actinomycetota bacterium]|nr:hypothetical protein [Actinomycetota bacterium]
MTRVVVCGLAGLAPVGGMGLHYLQYCLGLRDLGVDVFYLEDNGWPPAPPDGVDDPVSYSVRWLADMFGEFDIPWSYAGPDGVYHGAGEAEAVARCASADLLLNVSGGHEPQGHRRAARTLAYVDTDPGFIQVPAATGDRYRYDLLAGHDLRFTWAEAIGTPSCRLPTAGLTWLPTRQPVHLPLWTPVPDTPGSVYTTIMNWDTTGRFVTWQGERWGQKDAEFGLIRGLPARTGFEFEVALRAPAQVRTELADEGWRVRDAEQMSRTVWDVRDYLAASKAEVTVVKQAYARSGSGWFPERSANYLAAGRAVVCQDTGWSAVLDAGDGPGLFAVSTPDEAEAAVREVERDPSRHGAAARRVAAAHFDARVVLERLLSDAGVD